MIADMLMDYKNTLKPYDTNEEWFEDVKKLAVKFSFAVNQSDYKKNKDAYKGSISDVSAFLRMSITKRTNSFDLFQIITILGIDKSKDRIDSAVTYLKTQG
jgi:glutamyl-tRNA synthetase